MKKLLIILLFCSSCVFWDHHIKNAGYAICTADETVSYQISNVQSIKQVSINTKMYELTYYDGSKDQFEGSCFIPK